MSDSPVSSPTEPINARLAALEAQIQSDRAQAQSNRDRLNTRLTKSERKLRVTWGVSALAALAMLTLGWHKDAIAQGYGMTLAQAATRIAALETKTASMSVLSDPNTSEPTVRFSGVNVQIVSGSGATDGTINGTGNLIVGYNEARGYGGDNRSGSHNLIVGSLNNYISYGGVVFGNKNDSLATYASVTGGFGNAATAPRSTVSGGYQNQATGNNATVSGGYLNTASGNTASVSGGEQNQALGYISSVSGGYNNTAGTSGTGAATGQWASIAGGSSNTAIGACSSVSGGRENTAGSPVLVKGAYGDYSSISGGYHHTATGDYNWIGGSYGASQ